MKYEVERYSQNPTLKTQHASGISLISLIITIIVIIILAAIVIFTGLSTPDRANFAKFVSEFSDFRTAVTQDFMQKKEQNAIEGKSRSDAQIYYSIAVGEDVSTREGADINLEPTVENIASNTQYSDAEGKIMYISGEGTNALNLGGKGIKGTYAYRVTNDTNVAEWKQDKKYYAPDETHWITDEGDVFVLPGYRVMQENEEVWYYNEMVSSNSTTYVSNTPADPTPDPTPAASNTIANRPYTSGEVVEFGNEKFFVVKEMDNGSKVMLLAMYCLTKSGDAQIASGDCTYSNYGRRFSNSNYWSSDLTKITSETEASGDNATCLATYGYENAVMMAKHYGELKGVEGRLMTKTEAEEAGCTQSTNATTCPTWMSGRWTDTATKPAVGYMYWWLGSAYDTNCVWVVHGLNGDLYYDGYYSTSRGVRPVIIVSKS